MLKLDEPQYGLFVKLASVDVLDMIAAAGFNFAIVDLEHSQLSEREAFVLLRHANLLGLPALLRIPSVDHGLVNRALEAGASGIQLSSVVRAAQVRALRSATRYAPDGSRSVSLSHPIAGFGALGLAEYLRQAQAAPPLVIAQIESAETEDPLAEIFAAGPDIAFLGMTDLTVEVGLDTARAHARAEQVIQAATDAGVRVGAFAMDDPRVIYRAVSSDLSLLRKALRDAR